MILIASVILVNQGACEVRSCDWFDIDHRASLVIDACGHGPREQPRDSECYRALSAVWGTETGGTWSLYPPYNRTGCGPGQVIPYPRWGNTRLGHGPTPTCTELRVPRTGLHWAVKVLRAKVIKHGWRRPARVFRAYNGSKIAQRYQRAAMRRFLR